MNAHPSAAGCVFPPVSVGWVARRHNLGLLKLGLRHETRSGQFDVGRQQEEVGIATCTTPGPGERRRHSRRTYLGSVKINGGCQPLLVLQTPMRSPPEASVLKQWPSLALDSKRLEPGLKLRQLPLRGLMVHARGARRCREQVSSQVVFLDDLN